MIKSKKSSDTMKSAAQVSSILGSFELLVKLRPSINEPQRKKTCLLISAFVIRFSESIISLGVFHANQISMCLDPHLN